MVSKTELPQPIGESRRYTHEELQDAFGPDYRERVKRFFVEKKIVPQDFQLEWLSHIHPDYTHPDSYANYLLWMKINDGKDMLIVSAVPPNRSTSPNHSHPGNDPEDPHQAIEEYGCLFAEFDLEVDGSIKTIRKGETHTVFPGEKHRVKTKEQWALIPIFIENGGLYPPEQLHRR